MLRKPIVRIQNNEEMQEDQKVSRDQEVSASVVAEPLAKYASSPLTKDLHRSLDQASVEDVVPVLDGENNTEQVSDENLYVLDEPTRKPKLPEGNYPGTVGRVKAEKMASGKYGPWIQITLPFHIKRPETGEPIEVRFVANKSMSFTSRLFPIVKGILGKAPETGFNLRELEGQSVTVGIEHNTDAKGNVWDNVAFVRPLR